MRHVLYEWLSKLEAIRQYIVSPTRTRHEPKMAVQSSADGQGRSTKGAEGRNRRKGGEGEDIEKRSCDQESQLPTLTQVRPVEHIFPT